MISIVVPVYNVEKYIVNCLNSIVHQDYADFELILVNDGSTDRSIEIAQDYLKGKKIDYKIINKENGGLASARNTGLKNAKGEYVSFIDSDDCITKDFYTNLLSKIDNQNIDFSFCNFAFTKSQNIIDENNDKTKLFDRESLMLTFLRRTINFVVPSMLFKKEFLVKNDLFFNEGLRFSEDQPFIWNVILHSKQSVYLYKKMYGYLVRSNSIMTSTSFDKIMNSFNEYKDYTVSLFKDYPEYKNIADMVLARWELGTLYTCAKLVNFENYMRLYNAMGGKTILSRIKGIKERNAYLLGMVCYLSPKLMYKLCRRMNLSE